MSKVIIIAEAGVNHNGSLDLAKKLVDAASTTGADYIKFQTFKTELNISPAAKKAEYQIANSEKKTETQAEMLQKLELGFDQFRELQDYCKLKGIAFLSTAFDIPSVDFLYSLGIELFKIPSGEITNKPLLQYIASKAKRLIISTGMANLQEVKNALEIVMNQGINLQNICVLHCTTEYPAPMADVNLKAMATIAKELGTQVGYSDHTNGIEVPIAAVALGATVIEKHFTLDRTLPGPDHAASLEPTEFRQMVKSIRNIELAIAGNGKKEPATSEIKNIQIARKSLFYNAEFKVGYILSDRDFSTLRPGTGISPMQIDELIGRKLTSAVKKGQQVSFDHFR